MVAEELRKARETTAKVILDSSFCKKTPNSRLVPWWLDATIFIEKNRLFGYSSPSKFYYFPSFLSFLLILFFLIYSNYFFQRFHDEDITIRTQQPIS